MEHKVDKGLVALLAQVLDEALGRERLPELVSGQAVLPEHVVERVQHCADLISVLMTGFKVMYAHRWVSQLPAAR